jgi:hypothetical protein
MDLDPNTLIAAGAGLAGVIVGAALSEGRTILAENRARHRHEADETKAWWLNELRQTRKMLGLTVALVEALAIGDPVASERAASSLRDLDSGTLAFIDDPDTLRSYQDLLVDLENRVGQGLRVEDRIRSVTVMGRIADALNEQEERVRRGDAPRRLAPEVADELFNGEEITKRLLVIDQPPSTAGWLARRWIDFLALRTQRRRRRDGSLDPPHPPEPH